MNCGQFYMEVSADISWGILSFGNEKFHSEERKKLREWEQFFDTASTIFLREIMFVYFRLFEKF